MRFKFWEKKTVGLNDIPSKKSVNLPSLLTDVSEGVATVISDTTSSYIKNGYEGNADVYSIINKIVRMASQSRQCLYTKDKKGKWVEVTDHELNKFLRKVNSQMTAGYFQEGHLIYKLCVGNSYWWKPILENGLNKGKTLDLWLLPVNAVTINLTQNWMNPVKGYILNTGISRELKPEEVNHSKFFNPDFVNSPYGMSPLKAAARIVSKQNQGEITQLKQFDNQAPPYILYKDTTDMMDFSDLQTKQMDDMFSTYSKHFKIGHPFVSPVKMGMIQMGVSPVDLQILESSKDGRRVLCSIYGIDSNLFNDKEASTYNNMKEVEKAAWLNCIKPNLTDFDDSLTSFLIDPVEEYRKAGLFFGRDYSGIDALQADKAITVTYMKQGYATPNEIRDAIGLNPIQNPIMDEPIFPMAETPLSQMTADDELTDPKPLKNLGDY